MAHRCLACGARFFDRRNACASCGQTEFERVRLASTGTVRSFTVVYRATPDVTVPYISVVVRLDDGKAVKGNLVGVTAEAGSVVAGMRVVLTTGTAGSDPEGTQAVVFAFRPAAETTGDSSQDRAGQPGQESVA